MGITVTPPAGSASVLGSNHAGELEVCISEETAAVEENRAARRLLEKRPDLSHEEAIKSARRALGKKKSKKNSVSGKIKEAV